MDISAKSFEILNDPLKEQPQSNQIIQSPNAMSPEVSLIQDWDHALNQPNCFYANFLTNQNH